MKIIKILLRICKFLLTSFLGILLLINVVNIIQSVILHQEMPILLGYGRAVVVTGSMEPAIAPGDMIIFRNQADYEVDEIVIYHTGSYVTHRIVEETESGYITKGDANNAADSEITDSQIVGKVIVIIPKMGYVTDFFKSPFGMLIVIAGLFLVIELPVLIRKIKRRS